MKGSEILLQIEIEESLSPAMFGMSESTTGCLSVVARREEIKETAAPVSTRVTAQIRPNRMLNVAYMLWSGCLQKVQ